MRPVPAHAGAGKLRAPSARSSSSSFSSRHAAREEAAHLIEAVASLYAPPDWTYLSEVRSTTGATYDVLRRADALAVRTLPAGGPVEIHGFEGKRTRKDFTEELRHPEKSAPFALFCTAWWLIVPCPWKKVVLGLAELPDRWGLVEVAGSTARVVVPAGERVAEEPTPIFMKALLRAAFFHDAAGAEAGTAHGAPLVPITRVLSRTRVGLACGHVAPRPLDKVQPLRLPCIDCLEGRPTEREAIEGALADASAEDLQLFAALLSSRMGGAR